MTLRAAPAACVLLMALWGAGAWAQASSNPGANSGAKPAQADPNAIISSANVPLPARETDYIRLIFQARRQFAAGRSVDARRDARMDMQIAVHQFMGLAHYTKDWIGVFTGSRRNRDGTESLEVEIAPGVTIGTWDNGDRDRTYGTMIKPFSPVGRIVDQLAIGDTVVFSANLLGTMVVGSDDDMVQRPQVVARFSSLAKYEDNTQKK